MDFAYPTNICFECNGCALCCGDTKEKIRHILLLASETSEISAQTGLSVEEFAQRKVGKDPYVFEMKKPLDGRCFFLKDNRCAIYSQRPLICRFYPFELKFGDDQGIYVFDFTLECPTIGKGKTLTQKDFEELYLLASKRLC